MLGLCRSRSVSVGRAGRLICCNQRWARYISSTTSFDCGLGAMFTTCMRIGSTANSLDTAYPGRRCALPRADMFPALQAFGIHGEWMPERSALSRSTTERICLTQARTPRHTYAAAGSVYSHVQVTAAPVRARMKSALKLAQAAQLLLTMPAIVTLYEPGTPLGNALQPHSAMTLTLRANDHK